MFRHMGRVVQRDVFPETIIHEKMYPVTMFVEQHGFGLGFMLIGHDDNQVGLFEERTGHLFA